MAVQQVAVLTTCKASVKLYELQMGSAKQGACFVASKWYVILTTCAQDPKS